jgi:putative oxidoreductase
MEKFLGNYTDHIYALVRIIVGLLFACHGAQKVFGWFGGVAGGPAPLPSLFGVAGLLELFLGALVAVGFLAGYAAFLASGEMAVAYFIAHFPQGFWPISNGGELAVLFSFIFLYMAARGAGIWSIDGIVGDPGTSS